MKKTVAFILAFAFTLQVSAPSFAQNTNQNLQALGHCVDQITQNGEVFKIDAGIGNIFNRLNVLKGFILLNLDDTWLLRQLDGHPITKIDVAGSGLTSLVGLYFIIKGIRLKPEEFHSLKGFSSTRKMLLWFGASTMAIFGSLTYLSYKNYTKYNVTQNNQEISPQTIQAAQTEHDLTTQLASESPSAQKLLNDTVTGCYKILAEIKFYEKNPKLLEQEFQKNRM